MAESVQLPDEDTREAMPQEKRRAYMQQYQRELRTKRKRLELSLLTEDYVRLEQEANRHGLKVATFAREAMFAYLDEQFILPDQEQVRQLELALRRIGNEISQITRRMADEDGSWHLDRAGLHQRLGDLEDAIVSALREPPPLLELIGRRLKEDPSLADRIQALFMEHRAAGDADVREEATSSNAL